MTKKFDVVIGNPPYNEDATGDSTHNMPVYHLFMDAAYELGNKAVLITPARFLFDAGYTPKSWNRKMLEDRHLQVPLYVSNSDALFPGTGIEGGVVVTYRDIESQSQPIGTFTRYPTLTTILRKIAAITEPSITDIGITNDRVFRYSEEMHTDFPEASSMLSGGNRFKIDSRAFSRLPKVFHEERPSDDWEYLQVLGLDEKGRRAFRWARRRHISGPEVIDMYKVALPISNGSADLGGIGKPVVLGPGTVVTGTFLTIGSFEYADEAEACFKYVQGKLARAMVGVLKITQHNPARVWKHVPLQDFTAYSDIDWSKPISEIDQQLYAKYGLSDEEIEFIETHVKPMD